jgi:hypothetical protein
VTVKPIVRGTQTAEVQGLELDEATALDLTKFGRIEGSFPNPGSLDLDDFVSTRTSILAASPRQIVTTRPADDGVKPGSHALTIKDTKTGQTATTDVVYYLAEAKLSQVRVPSGSQTHLVVTVSPKELVGDVDATILSGPVSFPDGKNEMTLECSGGTAQFPLVSSPGSAGKFDVSWQFTPKKYKSHFWEPKKNEYKSHLWTPPKEDPPKQDDPPKRGGDTKPLAPDWEPFDEGGRKGRRLVKFDGDTRTETKFYDDGGTELKKTTEKGDTKTEVTDTTKDVVKGTGTRTEVHEESTYKKDDKGEWVQVGGTKTTKTYKDGKLVETKDQTYDEKKGWTPK